MTDTIKKIISLIDLTCLDQNASEEDIERLCEQASQHNVASVCIFPKWTEFAKSKLINTKVAICTVSNFPTPTLPKDEIIEEIKHIQQLGADECDIVFPYNDFDPKNSQATLDWLTGARDAANSMVLKVIIESGHPESANWLEPATRCIVESGCDFVKTSTGKNYPGADHNSVTIIAETLRQCNRPCGLKISGGVSTHQQASEYMLMIKQILGESFETKQFMRFGASSLLNNCLEQQNIKST